MGRNIFVWIGIAFALMFVFNTMKGLSGGQALNAREISYSDFMTQAAEGQISDITISGDKVSGNFSSSSESFITMVPPNENVVDRLEGTAVQIAAEQKKSGGITIFDVLFQFLPILLLIGFWFFMIRQMNGRGGGGGAM